MIHENNSKKLGEIKTATTDVISSIPEHQIQRLSGNKILRVEKYLQIAGHFKHGIVLHYVVIVIQLET